MNIKEQTLLKNGSVFFTYTQLMGGEMFSNFNTEREASVVKIVAKH